MLAIGSALDQSGGDPTCPAGFVCRIHPGFLGPTGLEAAGVCDAAG